jgi:hypothetical protein
MKIAINVNSIETSWGGGNQFIINLKNYLIKKKCKIFNNLKHNDLDIILIIDPRWRNQHLNFTVGQSISYRTHINKNTKIIHRINECDERKNTNFINKILKRTNYLVNHTVFVSEWLKNVHNWDWLNKENTSVILNGSNRKIFFPKKNKLLNKKIKIVTHHWSNHWMKGFKYYLKIDKLLESSEYSNLISFTYIGNLPKNNFFKNTIHIKPLNGIDLRNELVKYDFYITASENEPGGNHNNEAVLCGLPILYLKSGSMDEYCKDVGIAFDNHNFVEKLTYFIKNFDNYIINTQKYLNDSDKMSKKYFDLFNKILTKGQKNINKPKFYTRLYLNIETLFFIAKMNLKKIKNNLA